MDALCASRCEGSIFANARTSSGCDAVFRRERKTCCKHSSVGMTRTECSTFDIFDIIDKYDKSYIFQYCIKDGRIFVFFAYSTRMFFTSVAKKEVLHAI